MATAYRVPGEPIPPPPDQIQLVLSIEEAETIRDLCGIAGGDPVLSRRRHTDSVADALSAAGIEPRWKRTRFARDFDGSIIKFSNS